MKVQSFTLAELKKADIEVLIKSIAGTDHVLNIILPDGSELILQSKSVLQPLPVLEGYVPKGWKEALYE